MTRAVEELQAELDLYRRRYRAVEVPPEVERMQLAIQRRQNRVDHLKAQIQTMVEEVARIEAEIAGCRKGHQALLADTIDRVRRHHGEGWSPFPVTGFRIWGWRQGALHGAWQPWRTTSKTATCSRSDEEVPHSDGRCGRLGCGIYATKELRPLLEDHTTPNDHGYLAAMVELTGKVVEHERGYRAARAEVVAGVLVGRSTVLASDDAHVLDDLFRDPDAAMDRLGLPRTATAWEEIEGFLTTRRHPWTSDSRSA